MLAARLYGPKNLRVEEVATPRPPSGWVLIKTIAVGICGTDKAFYTGRYKLFKTPLIPGHEVVGTIMEGPQELIGKIVVSEINFSCGTCDFCRHGLYTHCPNKKTLGIDFDGGMAEYFIAPTTALHSVEGLDPVVAVEVEPLAALLNMLELLPPNPSSKVAVIGTGNLAYLVVQLLRDYVSKLYLIARRDSPKVKYFDGLVDEVLYVDEVLRHLENRMMQGLGIDMAIEVSGDPNALDLAIAIVRPRGVVHLKSTPGQQALVSTTVAVVKEVTIVCSRCGTSRHFRNAIELLKRGRVKPLITHIVRGIERAKEAFELSLRREEIKVVLMI